LGSVLAKLTNSWGSVNCLIEPAFTNTHTVSLNYDRHSYDKPKFTTQRQHLHKMMWLICKDDAARHTNAGIRCFSC